jgi:hypothetical protein
MLKLALGATIYFRDSTDVTKNGIAKIIDLVWPIMETRVKSFQTTNMKQIKKLGGLGMEPLRTMLAAAPSPVFSSTRIDNRLKPDEAPDSSIALALKGGGKAGHFALRFPADTEPDILVKIARIAIDETEIAHGYCGFTLAYNRLSLRSSLVEEKLFAIGMRHPGIDLPSEGNTSFVIADGIKRVNWITLLGSDLVSKVRLEDLGKEARVSIYSGRFGRAIRAGEVPTIGDVNKRATCELYHIVGRVLEPIRNKTHPAFILDASSRIAASAERTEHWLSSLDN